MTRRTLTAEERRLWLEANRDTRRMRPPLEECPAPPEAIPCDQETLQNAAPEAPQPRPQPSRARTPLTLLPTREAQRRFRAYPVEATLDLHGETRLNARERVQHFVLRQARAHRRHLAIITGKGKADSPGVLREYLPDWLNEPPLRVLISAIAYAPPEKGGTGVTHVLLKAP